MLSNILKCALHNILSQHLLKGKGLLYNILVANEVVKKVKYKKKKNIIVKVDYEKIHHSVK